MTFWDAPHQLKDAALFEGALFIARDAYPGLDFAEQYRRIDELAAPLLRQNVRDLGAWRQAEALTSHLSARAGFRGNQEDYYAPENSHVNRVLERRLGIPISLAVVYIAVAQKAGIKAVGVGFPGHFLLRVEDREERVLIDPFSGRLLARPELVALLDASSRGRLSLDDSMLEATPARHVLVRMLFNLRHIYANRGDFRQLLLTLDRLVALMPEAHEHRRDRGLLCARFGAVDLARADLTAYLEALPHAADAGEVDTVLAGLLQFGAHPTN